MREPNSRGCVNPIPGGMRKPNPRGDGVSAETPSSGGCGNTIPGDVPYLGPGPKKNSRLATLDTLHGSRPNLRQRDPDGRIVPTHLTFRMKVRARRDVPGKKGLFYVYTGSILGTLAVYRVCWQYTRYVSSKIDMLAVYWIYWQYAYAGIVVLLYT